MKALKVLVTAGDTSEAIDEVRRITHMSTGRLGSEIATEFVAKGAEVTYLCGKGSARPDVPLKEIHEIVGVLDLEAKMIELLQKTKFDVVVSSMAVSDYTVRGLTTEEDIAEKILAAITKQLDDTDLKPVILDALHNAYVKTEGKISSDMSDVVILLDQAPKVISHVKELNPEAILVGFKLLVDVSEEEFLKAARHQVGASGSDFVLANDLSGIGDGKHRAILIKGGEVVERLSTKQEIASAIVRNVMKATETTKE